MVLGVGDGITIGVRGIRESPERKRYLYVHTV